MWQPRNQYAYQPPSEVRAIALEANAACAGLALACAYSSSEEFEAELISTRRAAGAYRASYQGVALLAFAIAAMAFVAMAYLTA